MYRHAIVDYNKCKPSKCNKECAMKCPSNSSGKKCIVIEDIEDFGKKAMIYTDLCIGCGICIRTCPFNAISIVNIPHELSKDKILYSYGENSFRVYNFPSIKKGQCIGLLGENGLGKSTILNMLSGSIKLDDKKCKSLFGGNELFKYMSLLNKNNITVSYKKQDITSYKKGISGETIVNTLFSKINQEYINRFNLTKLADRAVKDLSGGETQQLLISLASSKKADSYLFDEPTAFLDIKQRVNAAQIISEKTEDSYVLCVEHDLCIFDYICDYVCCLYGEKNCYGVVTSLYSTFNGINNYIKGFLSVENIKTRQKPLTFRINTLDDTLLDESLLHLATYSYGSTKLSYETFSLDIEAGSFSTSDIILLIGENGTGKTSFINHIVNKQKNGWNFPDLTLSVKEQNPYDGLAVDMNVRTYLQNKIGNMTVNYDFKSFILKPLKIEDLYDLNMTELSGGQMQKIAIVEALGKESDIYLLDEPSAYIDVEDRLRVAKAIRQWIYFTKKTLFLVEHDLIMATTISDKIIVFSGEPATTCRASSPMNLSDGINLFLKNINVTMRKDMVTGRPRINKLDGVKDKEQKTIGKYYILE